MQTVVATVREWIRRSNDRYLLACLSERQLRDIGLDFYRAQYEATKPFWRA